ncbi:MAG: zinc finger protein 385 [Chloroflexi bacterium]|nr:zinc finger protein 385 [Chloroflexota bacterium]
MKLVTVGDAKVAILKQASRWWGAAFYHCPICDRDFRHDLDAANHLVGHKHPVLRWDAAGRWA